MSKFLNKFKPTLLVLIRYIAIIVLIGFLFFVLTFWYLYIWETSWGFNRLADWWIYIISIVILLPWELLWGLRKTKAYSKTMGNFSAIRKILLHNKNKVTSALTEKEFVKRLRNASLALIIFILFAEEYVVREFSTTSKLLSMWYSVSNSLKSTFFNIITYISTFDAIRPSYELRGFVFYIVGLIILRQGIRYIFSTWVTKFEIAATQIIDDIYNEPNKTKLISYSILTLIVLVFISYILGQGSDSLTIVSPLEKNKALNYPNSISIAYSFEKTETISATLIINDFDMITSKLTGNLTLAEKQHPYNEGGCYEDYLTIICEDPSGFPPLFYNDKNMVVNGKQLPVSISNNTAIVVDENFSNQASGNNYFFPFNEYISRITVSPNNFWNYAAIRISTNHRFFSIYQEPYQNWVYTPNGSSFYFRIGYAPYYKILVVVIFFALFSFLWVIWQTKERETLIELSIGVFATIITMRGFLIPQEFSNDPIFLDQVLLVYIALFLFILLYKHETLKNKKSA